MGVWLSAQDTSKDVATGYDDNLYARKQLPKDVVTR